jgi:acyl carrier protein
MIGEEREKMLDKNRVREKMASLLNQPVSKLEDGAVLTALVVESFALIEMVIELQEEFGVRLVQEDLRDVKTVGDLTNLISNRPG